MLVALAIFIGTLVLVIWQPRGLGVGWSAMSGAGLALLTGVVGLADIPTVWGFVWNATFTFVAVIIISLVLDEADRMLTAREMARRAEDAARLAEPDAQLPAPTPESAAAPAAAAVERIDRPVVARYAIFAIAA